MESNTVYLLDLLSKKDVTFFIPPYQRNYEWTKEQCQVFLDDIRKTCSRNITGGDKISSEHFFGTITYFQTKTAFGEPDKLILVDGQQRITTTMLFLAALRDIIMEAATRDYIDSHFLKNSSGMNESRFTVKLKQVETDWVPYRKIVLGEAPSWEDLQTAIYTNYLYFRRELINAYGKGKENAKSLEWVQFGLRFFRVVSIELAPERNSWENPQEIFESMNSLGEPLSFADLVRNYLLMGLDAEQQTDYYNRYWIRLEQLLPGEVSNFIRDYMQLHECRSFPKATEGRAKELYREFKRCFDIEIACNREQLLAALLDYAQDYRVILFGETTGNKKVDAILEDFRVLSVTTAYSFFLSLLHAYNKKELSADAITDILDAFRTYIIRRRICGLVAGENKEFPRLPTHLGTLKSVPDKKDCMFGIVANQQYNLRLPNDCELENELKSMNFYNFQYGKLCLAMIEESLSGQRPDVRSNEVQVDFIMPRILSSAWRQSLSSEDVAQHAQDFSLIGNLVLVAGNQSLGGRSFAGKKEVYECGDFCFSKQGVINQERWTSESIHNRTEALIQHLKTHVLMIPGRMRLAGNYTQLVGDGRLSYELLIGEKIAFSLDPTVVARVIDPHNVEFEGRRWKLSPLTREIMIRRGECNPSGSYQGARYWTYEGTLLADLL